jgi:hypothetical protein
MSMSLQYGRPRPALRWIGAGVALVLVGAVAGWFVAHRIASRAPAAATDTTERVLAAGPARLRVSAPWTRARQPPDLPGLAGAPAWTPYAGLSTTVSVALLPAQQATLLPTALVRNVSGALPRAQTARLVGLHALAYHGVRSGQSLLDVYAIPTTRGVLTLVCTASGNASEAPAWCLNGLDGVTVNGARPVMPAPDTAYRLGAPPVLRPLDRARVRQRRALRAAHLYGGQGRAARALATAYAAAARELAPLVPSSGPAAAVPGALRNAAGAYGGLARAAAHRNRRAWNRGRGAVARAEAAVKRRVAAAG